MCVPQIITFAVVEKRLGHKGEQRLNHDLSNAAAAVGKKHI